jgi:hypothetical protein
MIDRSIALLVIGLIFGGGIGFVIAAGNGITLDGHDHSQNLAGHAGDHAAAHANGDDSHTMLHDQFVSIPPGSDAPRLNIELTPDPVSGWNLHVIAQGFRFSPRNAGGPHIPGEGHAHVYVNGQKIARLYGPWLHLDALPDGPATIRVSLHANDHRALAVGQKPIVASATINAK